MRALIYKELVVFFGNVGSYVILGLFLLAIGLLMWLFPDTSLIDGGYSQMNNFFITVPFVYVFFAPAVSMRSFAEERKSGTLELLFTRPFSAWEIILAKFLAAWVVLVVVLIPTLIYYYTLYTLGRPAGNIDTAAVIGSYAGLILIASVFSAVGVFSSSLTDSQMGAYMAGVFISFLLHSGFGALASLPALGSIQIYIESLGMSVHFNGLARGAIDTRDLVYFITLAALFIYGTRMRFNAIL